MIITEKLLALAAAYEQKAASLRLAAAELNGHQVAKKQARRGATGIEATIAEAALLRAQANGTNGGATTSETRRASWTPARRAAQAARLRAQQAKMRGPKTSSRGAGAATSKQRRQQTEKLLAKIAKRGEPMPGRAIRGLSILLQHGYLAKQGEGYVRTDKPFTV